MPSIGSFLGPVVGDGHAAPTLNGISCGLAGSCQVLAQNACFAPDMTAGRGFFGACVCQER